MRQRRGEEREDERLVMGLKRRNQDGEKKRVERGGKSIKRGEKRWEGEGGRGGKVIEEGNEKWR